MRRMTQSDLAAARHADDPAHGFVKLTRTFADAAGPDGLTFGDMLDRIDERAFGLLILVLAIPCLVPGLPGAQLIAVPILILSAQLLLGRNEPWLPRSVLRRGIGRKWLERMADFAEKRMSWIERLSRPRLRLSASGFGERFAGFWMMLAALTVMLPLTNTVPSVSLTLMSAGLIQRDGGFVLVGAIIAAAWVAFLIGLPVAALVFGAPQAVALWDSMFGWLGGVFG